MLKRDECKMKLTMKPKLEKKLDLGDYMCLKGNSQLEDSGTTISGFTTTIEKLDYKNHIS